LQGFLHVYFPLEFSTHCWQETTCVGLSYN
jgi:hypothetical protein